MSRLTAARSATTGRKARQGPPEDVDFPVTPMLDMAFQLLAFFVLTFQVPTSETHIDLDLPTTAAALPGSSLGEATPRSMPKVDTDLENDLWVIARADDLGELKSLQLGEASLPDLATLAQRLTRYSKMMEGRELRIRLVADDRLRFEVAARLITICNASGVSTIRLTDPAMAPPLDAMATPKGIDP